VRAALAAVCLILFTIVAALATVASVVVLLGSRRGVLPVARVWSRAVLGVAGVRLTIEKQAPLGAGPYLFLTNHQSNLDSLCLAPALPNPTIFVAKQELLSVPFLGQAMWVAGFIFIDRRQRMRAARSLDRAAARIRAGTSVLVFPEGTRSPDGRLQPFKKGALYLAAAARVPMVPIAVSGTGALMPRNSLRIRSGAVRVRFGAPIPVAENASVDELRALAERAVAALLE
jgi:1-acyl-sn-glycerol-3-phosphate acyltransferase